MATIARVARSGAPKGPDLVSLLFVSQRHKSTQITTSNYKRGTGGRSSFSGTVATVFGAKSALGFSLVNRLGKTGTQVICAYRGDPYYMRDFKLMGDLGQILFSEIDLNDEESLRRAMQYSDVVINLIGKEIETRSFTFHDVHVEGARKIARLAKEYGVEKFVHVSALNAGKESNFILPGGSQFLKTKYEGELAVREEFPEAIIMRPARFCDLNDKFIFYYTRYQRRYTLLTLFHGLLRIMPLYPGHEDAIRMPVRIKDVSQGIVNALKDPEAVGQTYQCVGPCAYTLRHLLTYIYRCQNRDILFDNRYGKLKMRARISEMRYKKMGFPVPQMTMDTLEKEILSDELDPNLPTLEDLGVTPENIEGIIEHIFRPALSAGAFREKSVIPPKPQTPPVEFLTLQGLQ